MPGEGGRGDAPSGGAVLRRARADDVELVFGWRNRPEIYSLGGLGRQVAWDEHARWFAGALADPDRLIFIILDEGAPAGLLRFDRQPGERARAVVSIYLVGDRQRRGLGTTALTRGIRLAREEWPDLKKIDAHVLPRNRSAAAFFRNNGFGDLGIHQDFSLFVRNLGAADEPSR